MKPTDPEVTMRFANETGVEIFQLLVTRSESLGDQTFEGMLGALMGATAVCLANVLRPAVEASPNRASAAEKLIGLCTKQVRFFLQSVVEEKPESSQ